MKELVKIKKLVGELSALLEGVGGDMPEQYARPDDQGEEHDGEDAEQKEMPSEDGDMKKKLMVAKLKKMMG